MFAQPCSTSNLLLSWLGKPASPLLHGKLPNRSCFRHFISSFLVGTVEFSLAAALFRTANVFDTFLYSSLPQSGCVRGRSLFLPTRDNPTTGFLKSDRVTTFPSHVCWSGVTFHDHRKLPILLRLVWLIFGNHELLVNNGIVPSSL